VACGSKVEAIDDVDKLSCL